MKISKELVKKYKAKLKKLELNNRNGIQLPVIPARIAFSGNGTKLFEAEDYMGNESWAANFIVDNKLKFFVDAAVMMVVKTLSKSQQKELVDSNGNFIYNTRLIGWLNGDNHKPKPSDDEDEDDMEPYNGFEGNWFLKAKRNKYVKDGNGKVKTELKPPKVYSRFALKPTDPPATSKDDEGVESDGSYVNVQVYIYPNNTHGTVSVSFNMIKYRNDEYEAFSSANKLTEEDEEAMFTDPEANEDVDSFGDDNEIE